MLDTTKNNNHSRDDTITNIKYLKSKCNSGNKTNSVIGQNTLYSSTTPSPDCNSNWTIGIYKKNSNYVVWNPLVGTRTENDAQETFRNYATKKKKKGFHPIFHCSSSSAVLFNNDTGMPVSFWSVNSEFDVAIILNAFEQQQQQQQQQQKYNYPRPTSITTDGSRTFINRSLVEQMVHDGDLPLVPKTQNRPVQEWLLKRSMDYTFSRSTVQFFACTPLRYARSTLYYFDLKKYPNVKGHVALTIDDAPCRFKYPENSQFSNVLDILDDYNARSTLMIIGQYVTKSNHNEQDLIHAVQKGHELGNHGMMDRSYHKDDPLEFAQTVDECNDIIQQIYHKADVESKDEQTSLLPSASASPSLEQQALQGEKNNHIHTHHQVKWFRAPHGKYTKEMEQVLVQRNLRNVMCDTYASCPIVQDGKYIGTSLAQKCTHGSILLLHMPEVGFREWCLVALEQLMKKLFHKGLQVVTVSELERLATAAS